MLSSVYTIKHQAQQTSTLIQRSEDYNYYESSVKPFSTYNSLGIPCDMNAEDFFPIFCQASSIVGHWKKRIKM